MENYIKDLDDIIENYPKYFSQKKFTQWRSLFDDNAKMIKVEGRRMVSFTSLYGAMPEQREYGKENKIFIEKWYGIEKHEYGNLATIKANYSLITDKEKREGVDVLTLHKGENGWKIVNLTYEQINLTIFCLL
ncbi:MAG: hypothetical protein QG567_1393 [Campylobacterota bacterium]|nr:hypothetical protein [Campylobacterota bacterium]